MTINWTGILCLALAVCAVVILVHAHDKLAAVLGTMAQVGPGHAPDDKVAGLMAFGLLALTIVALVAVLVQGLRK